MVGAVTAPVACVPLAPSEPVHPPEAVQAVALLELQVSIDVPPNATLMGDAVSAATGAGGGSELTVTVALAAALVPPGPEHVSEKVELAASAPVLFEPLAASCPLQPPVAAHAVACADDQVRVEAPPALTVVGFAVSEAVGGSLTMMVTLAGWLVPPLPEHVRVNVVSSASGPVLRLPFAANVPLHPPEAVQEVASTDDHVSVVEPPASMAMLDAESDADGRRACGAEPPPPPQAESTAAAASVESELIERMNSRTLFLWILFHGPYGEWERSRRMVVMPAASQVELRYVARRVIDP